MAKTVNKLIGNIILFSVMPRFNSILSLLIFPLITPFLTERDFGLWGLISSYYGIGFAISTLGLDINFVNSFFVYKKRFHYSWRVLSGIVHYSGLIFSLLLAALIYYILPDVKYKLFISILSAFPIFFQNISKTAVQLYTLREKALPISYRKAIAALFSVGITWLLIAKFKLGYWGWIVAYFSNAFLIYISFVPFIYFKEKIQPNLKLSPKRIYRYLKISIPLIPHTLALVFLSSSDRIIMDILSIDINEIGLYSLGYRMANYMFTIVAGFIAALTPRLQLFYRKKEFYKISHIIWISYFVIILITLIGSIWMQEIFSLLIKNETLHEAAPLGSIAIFASSFHVWYYLITMPLLIKEKTKWVPWTIIIPAFINIVLNFLTIPIFGYKSALFTTYFSYLITPFMGLVIPEINRYIKEVVPNFKKYIIVVAFLNTLFLIGTYLIIEASIIIRLFFTLFYLITFGFIIYRKQSIMKSQTKKLKK